MPLYDFVCEACGARFELLVRAGTTPACPTCASETLERLLSLPSVRGSATRDVVTRDVRRRDAAQAKDRVHEQAKYERNHD